MTDSPVVTIGVVIAPPTAALALTVAIPIVVIRVYHHTEGGIPILLLVARPMPGYLARGPPLMLVLASGPYPRGSNAARVFLCVGG